MSYIECSFAAVLIIFGLLLAVCSLPDDVSARRCPDETPDSLLTLYVESDLIVVASIESEKTLKMTSEYEYGSYFDVEKTLDVTDTLKGSKKDRAAYVESQFTPKNSNPKTDEPDVADAPEEEEYPGIGNQALFFLVKNAENNSYEPAHYSAAIKKLNDSDLHVYLKRIKELKKIAESKKDQLPKLTEWLVRLAEEPATRDEGTADLQASFMALEYERQEESEAASAVENVEGEEGVGVPQVSQKEPVFPDKNFRAESTSEIAKLLTDSQKDRLSNVLSHSINLHLAKLNVAENDAENEEEIMPDYELITLVGHWNKTYLAMNSYAALQNAGASNARKTSYLLNGIAYLFNDDKLFSIVGNYEYASSMLEDELTEYPEEEESAPIGEVSDAPVVPEISMGSQPAEIAVPEQTAEGTVTADKIQTETETIEKEVQKITFKQYKKILRDNFEKQYGILIAQSLSAK